MCTCRAWFRLWFQKSTRSFRICLPKLRGTAVCMYVKHLLTYPLCVYAYILHMFVMCTYIYIYMCVCICTGTYKYLILSYRHILICCLKPPCRTGMAELSPTADREDYNQHGRHGHRQPCASEQGQDSDQQHGLPLPCLWGWEWTALASEANHLTFAHYMHPHLQAHSETHYSYSFQSQLSKKRKKETRTQRCLGWTYETNSYDFPYKRSPKYK